MGKIRLLPEDLASQVAAGEVVERPASVVKELVENSIDAASTNIEICIQRGGISLIRVSDDGIGMNRDDALMCLERNATSKIRSKEDLAAIHTLGFRGEAIPSIASVSKFRLTTREADALTGTEILINGGKITSVKDCGEPPGTQIEVRSLFYNLPARRKFLRTENTEYSHLEQVIRTQAIAHQGIRFALVKNDRLAFQLPATDSLRERIGGLVGTDLSERLLEVDPYEYKGISIQGFIGPPGMGRSDRRQQLTYLNGRPVEAAMLTRALREGYHTALMKGQYPVTFLFIETNPAAVDVNVHPAKREVRFHDGFGVRDAVVGAIQETLRKRMNRPVSGVGTTGIAAPAATDEVAPPSEFQPELIPKSEQQSLRNDWLVSEKNSDTDAKSDEPSLFTARLRELEEGDQSERPNPVRSDTQQGIVGEPETNLELELESESRSEFPATSDEAVPPSAEDYKLIGVLGKLYVLLESDEGLVLMDQHAAHERVLFEQLKKQLEETEVPSQGLLTPIMVELPPRDFDLVSQNLETLTKFGIAAEPFGGSTIKIDALPVYLKGDDPEAFFQNVIEEIRSTSDRMSKLRLGEDMIATTVCRQAVKANDLLRPLELQKLLEDLLLCDMPYCCPHGRPTLIQISYAELEKKFGRRT